MIKDCLNQLGYNDKNFPPKQMLAQIGRAKDELIDPDSYTEMVGSDFRLRKVAKIYALYQKKLKTNNALDFDDIIMYTVRIFSQFPEVVDYYQGKFKYILVDEYQDTNTAQYTLVSMLAQQHRNICVVGDDDQSIYGWRGANIRNILDFEKDFKDCYVVKLEQNYRSTEKILNAANQVIQNNRGRKPKTLWTKNPGDQYGCIMHRRAGGGRYTATVIQREVESGARKYGDYAILYGLMPIRVYEDAFMKTGVPYKIIGGHKFYDRKEIKDIIAYLRTIHNPHDDISLKRIINVPKEVSAKRPLIRLKVLQ